MGQYKKALVMLEEWKKIVEELGDREGLKIAYGNLGDYMEQHTKAIELYAKWKKMAEETWDQKAVGRACGNIAPKPDCALRVSVSR
jgi:hypothetical protein